MKIIKVKAGYVALSKQTTVVVVAPSLADAIVMMVIAIRASRVVSAEASGVINNTQATALLKGIPTSNVFTCRRSASRMAVQS